MSPRDALSGIESRATEERLVLDIPSPCIGVCRLDPASGLCAGCMRTLDEIAAWPGASGAERLAIVQKLRARRRAAGRTSAADSRPRRRRLTSDPC